MVWIQIAFWLAVRLNQLSAALFNWMYRQGGIEGVTLESRSIRRADRTRRVWRFRRRSRPRQFPPKP